MKLRSGALVAVLAIGISLLFGTIAASGLLGRKSESVGHQPGATPEQIDDAPNDPAGLPPGPAEDPEGRIRVGGRDGELAGYIFRADWNAEARSDGNNPLPVRDAEGKLIGFVGVTESRSFVDTEAALKSGGVSQAEVDAAQNVAGPHDVFPLVPDGATTTPVSSTPSGR